MGKGGNVENRVEFWRAVFVSKRKHTLSDQLFGVPCFCCFVLGFVVFCCDDTVWDQFLRHLFIHIFADFPVHAFPCFFCRIFVEFGDVGLDTIDEDAVGFCAAVCKIPEIEGKCCAVGVERYRTRPKLRPVGICAVEKVPKTGAERTVAEAEIEHTATCRLRRPGEFRHALLIAVDASQCFFGMCEKFVIGDEREFVEGHPDGRWGIAVLLGIQ